jgi:hypothetical protein
VINAHNTAELPHFLARCHASGITRLVLRRLYGDTRARDIKTALSHFEQSAARSKPAIRPHGEYRGNPVYDYRGMEVTVWNFADCECRSLNLFSDGTISTEYLLAKA